MATPKEWGTAYARQAEADFAAWTELRESDLPECQKLHFLQMACEKLAKAHLCKTGTDPKHVQTSHAFTNGTLPLVIRLELDRQNVSKKLVGDLFKFTKRLAREIELLAPSVDDGGRRPDNCEYPWEDGRGTLRIPRDYTFIAEQLLAERHAQTALKFLALAIRRLAR